MSETVRTFGIEKPAFSNATTPPPANVLLTEDPVATRAEAVPFAALFARGCIIRAAPSRRPIR
ncbi:MAG: hypothetical protein AAGA73_07215 [Pseudomonadota bacterium]